MEGKGCGSHAFMLVQYTLLEIYYMNTTNDSQLLD